MKLHIHSLRIGQAIEINVIEHGIYHQLIELIRRAPAHPWTDTIDTLSLALSHSHYPSSQVRGLASALLLLGCFVYTIQRIP